MLLPFSFPFTETHPTPSAAQLRGICKKNLHIMLNFHTPKIKFKYLFRSVPKEVYFQAITLLATHIEVY